MQMNEPVRTLITSLMAAKNFTEAAGATLRAMLGCAEAALVDDNRALQGRLLRGVVHVRPEDGYKRLFGVEHPSGARVEGTGYLTSANVWKWVSEHRTAVSIDVRAGTLHTWFPEGVSSPHVLRGASGLPGRDTRDRMMDREATHVHVVPVRVPSEGSVAGMISLEAHCPINAKNEDVWGACRDILDMIAAMAASHLISLPPQRIEAPQTDGLMPVAGPSTAAMIDLLRVFARQDETILLSGPTGVGKSRLARWCHAISHRKEQPFETFSLLGVPEDLQMAELLGWRRGAFTGALSDTPGALARAAKGTLFIDEIDKLSLKAQAGLLRMLEERRYRPLGDKSAERPANARFIVSTNADLGAAVRAGRFREDLYYRINVLPIRLPPLAERQDELPLWAEYMLTRRHGESGAAGKARISAEAMDLLRRSRWPGNLRQLDNIIRRAYAIMLADAGEAGGRAELSRRDVERALGYEHKPEIGTLIANLWRAARSYVDEAERRESSASPLSFDHCDVFRGMVICAALERRGDRDGAFALLDRRLLKNRNHHRALLRELARVRALVEDVGGDVDPKLTELMMAGVAPED